MTKELKLKGNELGWIFRLAKSHFDSKEFQECMKKYPKTNEFIQKVITKINPNNINPQVGEIWVIKRKKKNKIEAIFDE